MATLGNEEGTRTVLVNCPLPLSINMQVGSPSVEEYTLVIYACRWMCAMVGGTIPPSLPLSLRLWHNHSGEKMTNRVLQTTQNNPLPWSALNIMAYSYTNVLRMPREIINKRASIVIHMYINCMGSHVLNPECMCVRTYMYICSYM